MFNPFEHFDELVHTNIDGGPVFGLTPKSSISLPDGQKIAAATPGQPDTLTFWLKGVDGVYDQITHDMEFVQNLWLHARYGAPMSNWLLERDFFGLSHEYTITPDAMRAAVLSLPHVLADVQAAGYSETDVWAYAQQEAPWAVGLVGVPAT